MKDDARRLRPRRVSERPAPEDGFRILVNRLWPRGLPKDTAAVDVWLRDLTPSARLRKWYKDDPRDYLMNRSRLWGMVRFTAHLLVAS